MNTTKIKSMTEVGDTIYNATSIYHYYKPQFRREIFISSILYFAIYVTACRVKFFASDMKSITGWTKAWLVNNSYCILVC